MVSRSEALRSKTAVITGCNRGIGKAILERFAGEGADVFAAVRKEDSRFMKFIQKLSRQYQVDIRPLFFDLRDIHAIREAVLTIRNSKKPIDILVNNAGIGYNALFQMSSTGMLKEVFDVNFHGTFILTQYLSRMMVRQRSGNIINIASTAGIDGYRGKAVYGASKAALICLTRVIASELAEYGIRANVIAPGITETDIISCLPGEVISGKRKAGSQGKILNPKDIADKALYLAADLPAGINGEVFRIE